MTWTLARLGSRFALVFEPHHRRLRHSALGRFLDRPLDLMVGLVEPDGTERVMPFTQRGQVLYNAEQFERLNSITFRGYSERYRLRFEFNIHSVFYPQDERLCLMPAFYLEMRVHPADQVRGIEPVGPTPKSVKLFLRLGREGTEIAATGTRGRERGRIDLGYEVMLSPGSEGEYRDDQAEHPVDPVRVSERIVSLNPGCSADEDGMGLTLELPVTEVGSGIKWRLVWGAHCGDPLLRIGSGESSRSARLRYTRYWADLDAVMQEAVGVRDDRLAHSRRLEKLLGQAPLGAAERHLLNQGFQSFLCNTFWCDVDWEQGGEPAHDGHARREGVVAGVGDDGWFSVWDGSACYHSNIDVQYNVSMLYLALWPKLLAMQLRQWQVCETRHAPSGGGILSHDMGVGVQVGGASYPHEMPVEENSDFLLLLQGYTHWTGDLSICREQADLIERLADYLIWTDRDGSGFVSEGMANTIDDAGAAVQYSRGQIYLAVKRVAALGAAAELLTQVGRGEAAERCSEVAERDAPKIEREAWLTDHFAVCVDRRAAGVRDAWTGQPLPYEMIPGWDAYSIYTGNGLLLPAMTTQPTLLDEKRLRTDLLSAARETVGPYGCAHSSHEPDHVRVSQNLWRDHLAHYLRCGAVGGRLAQRYWDLQVMSNTGDHSLGFCDSYIGYSLSFSPRGATGFGYFMGYPRLVINRLSPGGARISVDPDRLYPQRWPLLPLADWKAGKIPICVVSADGGVSIEGEIDPVIIHGEQQDAAPSMIG